MPNLLIDVEARYAQFQDSLDKVARTSGRSVQAMERSFATLRSTLGTLGVGLSVGAFAAYSKSVVDTMAALDDMAESTGASVESLSRLTQIAKIGGQDVGVVENAVLRLNKALSGADDESKGAAEAFKAIGLSASELRTMAPDQALEAIAQAMNRFSDGAGKAAAGQAIFGKQWKEIAPLLKDVAENGGVVARVTAEQAAEAEKLQKALNRLRVESDGIAQSIGARVIPAMNDWIEANREAMRIAGSFGEFLRLFVFNLDAMTTEEPAEEIRRLTRALEEYQAASSLGKFAQSPTGFLFGGREEDLKKQIELLKFLQRQEALALGGSDTRGEQQRFQLPGFTKGGVPFKEKPKAETDTRARDLAASLKALQDIDDEARALGNKFLLEQSEGTEKLRQKYLDLIDPVQKYRDQLIEIDRLQEEGALTATQATEARFQINEAIEEAAGFGKKLEETNEIARELGLTFSSAFEDAALAGKDLSGVLEGLAKDVARIFLRKTVTEPLANALSGVFAGMIPSFDVGTDFVPRDTLAMVHRGERIIPASQNLPGMDGGMTYSPVINVDARGSTLSMPQIEGIVRRAVGESVAAVKSLADRGGNYARAMGRR